MIFLGFAFTKIGFLRFLYIKLGICEFQSLSLKLEFNLFMNAHEVFDKMCTQLSDFFSLTSFGLEIYFYVCNSRILGRAYK